MRLPIPLPENRELAAYIEARYSSPPEHWDEIERPISPRTRDGFLAALHFFYQNNPVFFLGGLLLSAVALLEMAYQALRTIIG